MFEINSTVYKQLVYLTVFLGCLWIGFAVNKFVLWCNEPPPPPSDSAQLLIDSIRNHDGWSIRDHEHNFKAINHTSGIVVRINSCGNSYKQVDGAGKFDDNDIDHIRKAADEEYDKINRRSLERKLSGK